jgi:voltage-gated potassium channel Kch
MLIRLVLAEWFVVNNVTIMKAFFTAIGNLVGLLSVGKFATLSIDSAQADIIRNLGFGESLVMLMLAALLSIIIIICGFFMIYTVYFRFLRLLVIVPMGSIAFSTMGGNRTVSHTAAAYCRYFLSVAFEAVTMALAIMVCNAFVNAGLPTFTADYADWTQTLIYLCEMTFTIALTVGSVKGAQALTSKAFGL